MTIHDKLLIVQSTVSVPKENTNTFGKYKYRSCEDILEALKPLLKENDLVLTLTDAVEQIGERYYVRATATVTTMLESGDSVSLSVNALAREEHDKKGMDAAQITGAASSYARKYALNGLFCIDDTKDADATNEHDKKTAPEKPVVRRKPTLLQAMEYMTGSKTKQELETVHDRVLTYEWSDIDHEAIATCYANVNKKFNGEAA